MAVATKSELRFRAPEDIRVGEKSLAEILTNHAIWLETDQKHGERAVLEGADLARADLPGVDLRKAILDGADLGQANLQGANFEGAVLGGVNLQEASLELANLKRVMLHGAYLREARLYGASLEESDLPEAQLQQANLMKANLRAANFGDADLTGAKGLLCCQLAGTNLAGAKLPPDVTQFTALGTVEEVSKNARTLFIAMLAACLYIMLTIGVTTDADLLTNRESAPLPFVDRSIPILGFFFVAPPLLLGAYFYLHFYMQNLWGTLSTLPAVFLDGIPLNEKAYPWLLNDRVRSHFVRLKDKTPFVSVLREWISVLLAWWGAPVILIVVWLRCLTYQNWNLTGWHIVLAAGAVASAYSLNRAATATLRGQHREGFLLKKALTEPSFYKRTAATAGVVAAFGLISAGAIHGIPAEQSGQEGTSVTRTWAPRALASLGLSPFANLSKQDVSTKPAGWVDTGPVDLAKEGGIKGTNLRFAQVKGADLKGANLRYAQADSAFLVKANLEEANLQGANLQNARLEEAVLREANLQNANLRSAQLERASLFEADLRWAKLGGANLTEANLYGTKLFGASLQGTKLERATLFDVDLRGLNLQGADLRGAHLDSIQLDGANLGQAYLQGAHLNQATLESAQLQGAHLQGVHLVEAALQSADLLGADLEGAFLAKAIFESANLEEAKLFTADLTGANLQEAELWKADLELANIYGANLRGVKAITSAQLQKASNWKCAFYSEEFLPGIGLRNDHNEELAKYLKKSQESGESNDRKQQSCSM